MGPHQKMPALETSWAAAQMAMLGGLPYTAIRDAVIAHPTMPEGLILLFGNVPPISTHAAKRAR